MYRILFVFVVVVSPSFGDLSLDPTAIGSLGESHSFESLSFEGTIDHLNLDLSDSSSDFYLDLSNGISTDKSVMKLSLISSIVTVDNTPFKDLYPEADRVYHTSSPTDSFLPDQWQYYNSKGVANKLLGIDGEVGFPALLTARDMDASKWPESLFLGVGWDFSIEDIEVSLMPGLDVTFAVNYTNIVDAVGTIVTPAGTFDVLRLKRVGEEIVSYKDAALASSIGDVRSQIVEYFWYGREGILPLQIREEVALIAAGGLPSMEQTLVTILNDVDRTNTAVRNYSWAKVKLSDFNQLD